MSNHFTGLSLGPPLGDQRLDLCDLYAFQSPADRSRTVIILNANPNADALHPDAIYRLNIDNDGDLLTDVALSCVFSKPQNGKQTFNVFLAKGAQSRSVEAVGNKIVADAEVSFDRKPNLVKAGELECAFGSVYVTADPARAGSGLVTIAVSNLDEHATALAARGLSLDELGADSSALRQLTITDDDGNCIKFFADPAQPTA